MDSMDTCDSSPARVEALGPSGLMPLKLCIRPAAVVSAWRFPVWHGEILVG